MTLRDYFAGQVLCGLFSDAHTMVAFKGKATEVGTTNDHDAYAQVAYNMADAMLAERDK